MAKAPQRKSATGKKGKSKKVRLGGKDPQLAFVGEDFSVDGMERGEAPHCFLNREYQWLEFNRRVLHQAKDPRTPLLERVRFMSIFTSNLDEFVMKRVGGLKRKIEFGLEQTSEDGLTPQEQLQGIRQRVLKLKAELADLYKTDIIPALSEHKIHLRKWSQLTDKQKKTLSNYYIENIDPVLTPLLVDTALPFPFISNLSLSLALKLQSKESGDVFFGRVKIPEIFPQWLSVESSTGDHIFVSLMQVIAHNVHTLFPDIDILKVMPFRVTRNAELEADEEGTDDLLETIVEEVKRRRFAEAVRLETGVRADPWMVSFLQEELNVGDDDIYETAGLLDYGSLKAIADLPLPHLKYPPWSPSVPPELSDTQTSIFEIMNRKDILVHHPYESFSGSVERFIRTAAHDPHVLAIKMTLYRTNDQSPIISSLIEAAEQGKQVVCLVELKARFDEERNIFWAQQMEKSGVHVIYGVVGLKTHCKAALVLRQVGKKIRAYAHLGTGNYNSVTARLYTDVGLFTARDEITKDVIQLFHFLTSRSFQRKFDALLVAPTNMKNQFLELIEREIGHQKEGRPAGIVAKCNSLQDFDVCKALYRASAAGVPVDLIVRGYCSLRAQVPGLSENIRVISVIGRFLEHSRIFCFRNGASRDSEGDFYLGSADWMRRNLHGRVEVVTPIFEPSLKRKLWEILNTSLEDSYSAWEMNAGGEYIQRSGDRHQGTHHQLMQLSQQRAQVHSP